MANYTQLNTDEVNTITSFFGIDDVLDFYPLKGGAANSSFIIKTTNNNYVLSVCNEKSLEETENLSKLLSLLEEHSFPTTRVVKSNDETAVISYQGKPVFLKKFIEGKVCNELTPCMLMQLGEKIADLHGITAPDYLPKVFPYGIDFFSDVTSSDLNPQFGKWLERRKDEIISTDHSELQRGLVHGDIFYDNVLFNGDKLTAIIDFEETSEYYLVFDLGMCTIGTCCDGNGLLLPKVKALIDGYQNHRKLSNLEKTSLQNFTMYGAVATSFWRYRQYNLINPEKENSNKYKEVFNLANDVASIHPARFIEEVF